MISETSSLHLSSQVAGFSALQPCLLSRPPHTLPASPASPTLHHQPLCLCLCWALRGPLSTSTPLWSQKQGVFLKILNIECQLPKVSFPSFAVGSATRCSNGLGTGRCNRFPSSLCHQPGSSLPPQGQGQPSLKPQYQPVKRHITANYLHCTKAAIILVRLSSSWPCCPALRTPRTSFSPR